MRRRGLLLLLGGAMAATSGVRAQQKPMPVIGILAAVSPENAGAQRMLAAFRDGPGKFGYVGLAAKRIELLSELVPQARAIAFLVNPNDPSAGDEIRDAQEAARIKGVQLRVVKAGNDSEIEPAFAGLSEMGVGALVVLGNPIFSRRMAQLVALASRDAVPAIYLWREFAESGGLLSYGPSIPDAYRIMGIYAGRILRGEKTANLPVQQPTRFELVVNLKTAEALGLKVPPSILARADEVIE